MSATTMIAFKNALLNLDAAEAQRLLLEAGAADSRIAAVEALVVPALGLIGDEWSSGEVALSQLYMSGRICENLLSSFLPIDGAAGHRGARLAIAVLEDHHFLGKRLVQAALRVSGYAPLDYGQGTVDRLAARATEDGVEILLVSALMLPSALRVAALRRRLDELGSKARIVVGGAPFRMDDRLWREVGADAMGNTATDCRGIVERLSGGAI